MQQSEIINNYKDILLCDEKTGRRHLGEAL